MQSKGNTAVLVIDAQLCAFDSVRSPACYDAKELLQKLVHLVAAARENEIPLLFVQHCGLPGQLYAEGTAQWIIHPAIAPTANELIVQKHQSSSFDGTRLEFELRDLGIETVVTCGLQSEFCVSNTCFAALELGFNVGVISDTHSTWSNDEDEAPEIIARQNALLASRGVVCQTLAEFVD